MEGEPHPAYALLLVGRSTPVSDARLERVYRSHAAMLHRRCLQILGDEQDALDALQDLFLKLRDKLDTYRGDASMTTWLYRIATNHCLNRLRNAKNAARHDRALSLEQHHDPRARFENRDLLLKLIAELDEEDVQLAFHRYYDGMTQVEIAEVLGVTERTVRNRLERLEERVQASLVRLEEVTK